METSEYIRELNRTSKEAEEKKQRLEAAIMEAEAVGDLTQLNKLAADEARIASAKGFVFKDVFELLDGPLPTMAGAMSFEYRVELCAYLGFMKKQYDRLKEQAPSEWQDKKFKQLMRKKKELELLLSGEIDDGIKNDASKNQTELSEESRPKERQAYFRLIWETHGKPDNRKVWSELRGCAEPKGPVTQVIGNDQLTFKYIDGSIAPILRKTFQNDMTTIRNEK